MREGPGRRRRRKNNKILRRLAGVDPCPVVGGAGNHIEDNMATRRMRVYRRDNGNCRFCGVSLPRADFTLDHLFPRSRGGPDWDINLVVACSPCNNQKGDKTIDDAGMELLGNAAFRDEWREIQWELAHGKTDRLLLDWRVIP